MPALGGASCLFGQHGDKLIGPTRGLTPLPIPNTLLVQIQLWQAHLNALDRRLAKLNFKTAHPVRERIQAILRSDNVNLLFIINKDGAPDSLSTKSLFYGEGKSLNHDFSRHMMPGLLAKHDVPFEYVQWWLRHHVDGTSASAAASTVIQQVWLSRVASALDRIALDLGLRPLHGIARTL